MLCARHHNVAQTEPSEIRQAWGLGFRVRGLVLRYQDVGLYRIVCGLLSQRHASSDPRPKWDFQCTSYKNPLCKSGAYRAECL